MYKCVHIYTCKKAVLCNVCTATPIGTSIKCLLINVPPSCGNTQLMNSHHHFKTWTMLFQMLLLHWMMCLQWLVSIKIGVIRPDVTRKLNVEKEVGLSVQQTKCKIQTAICVKYSVQNLLCKIQCAKCIHAMFNVLKHCAVCMDADFVLQILLQIYSSTPLYSQSHCLFHTYIF